MQEQFAHVIVNINRAECGSELNAAVKSINDIFLCCAEPYKCQINKHNRQICPRQSARWYDDECHKLSATYNAHRNRFRKSKDQSDKNSRDEAKSVYVALCKKKSATNEKEQTDFLLKCKYNDSKAFWKQIKPKAKNSEPCYVPLDKFKDHFAQLYISTDFNNYNLSDNYLSWNPILDRPVSVYEISAALRHLNECKSPGDGKIKSDFMLCDENNLKYVLTELFNKIYYTGHFPDQWTTGVTVPIFKKGDKKNPANYRGITLTSTMGKLFTYVLNQRFTAWAEESNFLSNAQFAYRTGYSTRDAIFVLNSILSHA